MFSRLGFRAINRATSRTLTPNTLTHLNHVRCLSAQSRQLIDEAVKAHPIVLFMKGKPSAPLCGFSRAVVQILDVQGADPEKIRAYDCLEDDELRNGIKEYSDWPTIPQVYVNGDFVGGCDILLSSGCLSMAARCVV